MRDKVHRHLFLAGFAGSGKTTVGKALAKMLKWPLVDLDEQIELISRMSIPQLFRERGERRFREIETREFHRICNSLKEPSVVSLGGGTLIDRSNLVFMKSHGISIYLRCSQRELARRLAATDNRPLIQPEAGTARSRAAVIRRLFAVRKESYERCDVTISVTKLTPAQTARKIRDLIS